MERGAVFQLKRRGDGEMDVWNQESRDNIGADVKKKNPVVIGGFLFGISLSVAVLFFLVKYFLPEDVEFRMWLRILWTVWIYLWAPFTFFVFLLCCIWGVRRQRENLALRIGLTAVTVLTGLISGAFLLLVTIFSCSTFIGKEESFGEGILQISRTPMLSEFTEVSYYIGEGPFLMKQYEPLSDIVLISMERKYGERFSLSGENGQAGTDMRTEGLAGWYVSPVNRPEMVIFARLPYGTETDNYPAVRALFCMEEAEPKICQERKLMLSPEKEEARVRIFCEKTEDIRNCAADAAALIKAALEDDFFWEEGRNVQMEILCQLEGSPAGTVMLYFGNDRNHLGEYGYEIDRYTDAEEIYKMLLYCYDGTEVWVEEEEPLFSHEDSAYFVEGAYKVLYDTLFAPAGYAYDCKYNAKGNFYGQLGEYEGTLESVPETLFDCIETVVYDRVSKNGKCHLFVHYRTYYQDGTEYTVEILNMYAVDMETGKVYVSGRHAWADLGSEEYREATGEP